MQLQTPRVLWFALLMSNAMYAVVGMLAAPTDGSTIDPTLLVALGVVALGNGVGAFIIGMKLRRTAYLKANFEVEEVPDPNAETMFRDSPPMIRQFAKPDTIPKRLMPLAFTPFILELALSESVAIFGLVAALLGADVLTWLPFIFTGATLIAVRFPTEARWLRALERIYDARMP